MTCIKNTLILFGLTLVCSFTIAQEQKNIAEKLGYHKDAKLLIVHADDIGLTQSVNTASIEAFNKGGITSGSIMVPCPWFQDFAEYFKSHPDLDVGIHATLTAEWDFYKWDGVMPSSEISSLLDENGYFYSSVEEVALNADPAEVEKELRAQIERAIEFGINPTHLDTHMGSVAAKPELIQIYLKLGKEYNLPVLIPRIWILAMPEANRSMIEREYVLVDGFFMMNAEPTDMSWSEAYEQGIKKLKPGLNQMIVHLAIDNAEMQAVSVNHPAFGSSWRQKDLDFVTSQEFKEMLKANDIQLVTWRAIQEVM